MKCKDIIEVKKEKEYAWCSCRDIAISGGLKELRRHTANAQADYTELSKYKYENQDDWDFL